MKTIDVRDGDRFERTQTTVYQYRDGKCRGISDRKVDEWWPDADTDDEFEITRKSAEYSFQRWGYTLTPAAKPKANGNCQQESKPETLTQPKPADVPVVDAVWVEVMGECVYAYTSIEAATKVWQRYLDKGEARIVRIRTVDDESRKLAIDAYHLHSKTADRLTALESSLAAVTEDARYARKVYELLVGVNGDKPADKPAARVVKAPKRVGGEWVNQTKRDTQWIAALTEAGITIADEGSKT